LLSVDLVIKNGKIVTPNGIIESGIVIDDRKIVSISKESHLPESQETIDAKGNLIFPGVIDAHTHISPWAREFRKDAYLLRKATYETESTSAAFGGTTSLIDFIIPEKNDDIKKTLERCFKEADSQSIIDFGFHLGITRHPNLNTERARKNLVNYALDKGITSFKMYMCYGQEGYDVPNNLILEMFQYITKMKGTVSIHAENEELIKYFQKKTKGSGKVDPMYYSKTRPNLVEEVAIGSILAMAKYSKVNLYICHVNTKEGLTLIKEAKQRGQHVFVETMPNYLLLTHSDMVKSWPLSREVPPFRSEIDKEALWEGIKSGYIDTLSTDHSPTNPEMKIRHFVGGLAGVELLLPLMFSEGVMKRSISPSPMLKLLCSNPAKIFGLYPKKGIIWPGSDADIVIFDPKKEWKIKAENLHSKAGFTIFENKDVTGFPIATILRGKIICNEGEFYGKPGYGQYLHREPLPCIKL